MNIVMGGPEAQGDPGPQQLTVEDRLATLAAEVESLRRANRRLRRLGPIGFAVAAFLGLLGMASGLLAQARRPAVLADGRFATIEAERLVIKDRTGQVRATLGPELGTGVGLKLFANGVEVAEYRTTGDGQAAIIFSDRKGGTRLEIVNTATGPSMDMYDSKGSPRVQFGLSDIGSPNLSLHHEKIATRFQLGIQSDGIPYMDFFDVKNQILPVVDKAGKPMVAKP